MFVVVVVGMVPVNAMPLGANQTPLAAEPGLVVAVLTGVALGARRRQRHTLCIGVRIRYCFGVGRSGFPTIMMAYARNWVVGAGFDFVSRASRRRASVGIPMFVRGAGTGPVRERHGQLDCLSLDVMELQTEH